MVATSILGWLGVRLFVTREQRRAIANLEAMGARVYFDFECNESGQPSGSVIPVWLHRLMGKVYAVNCSGSRITDADMPLLNAFIGIESLELTNTGVTDVGFSSLDQIHTLNRLYLGDAQITDESLEKVGHCRGLRFLILTRTPITDAGLSQLEALTNLQSLRIDGTKCSDSGVDKLKMKLPPCQIAR